MLLFYALPRVDTNPIAHRLLNRFHTLRGVFEANPDDLKQISGINDEAAVFLHILPSICKRYYMEKLLEEYSITSYEQIKEYLQIQFLDTTKEKIIFVCFDDNLNMIGCQELESGTFNAVTLSTQKLAEIAIRMHSQHVLLSHNHPTGNPNPSDSDIFTTRQIFAGLRYLDIQLIDHVIIGKNNQVFSMRESDFWQAITY